MPQSFTLRLPSPIPSQTDGKKRKVLVTGAAGMIGSAFAEQGRTTYDFRLMVRESDPSEKVDPLRACGDVVVAELSDRERLVQVCTGIDTVLHLAADPSPNATWESLLPNNIVGTYNLMWAAKAAKCRRVIYASSIHAVGGYGPTVQVSTSFPVNPGDLYGVTKCFGEALARYMAEQEGLSVIAIRIGAFQPSEKIEKPEAINVIDSWVSPRDLFQLFDRCIAADHLQWAVFNGLSANAFNRLDVSDARELLGYQPLDDSAKHIPTLATLGILAKLMNHSLKDPWAKSGLRDK